MLNAQSGLVDFLKPNGAIGAEKRPASGGQDSDGLFGDTLRGQMSRNSAERESRPGEATPRPTEPKGRSEAAAQGADKAETAADEPEQAVLADEAQADKSESDAAVLVREAAVQIEDLPAETEFDELLPTLATTGQEVGDKLLAEEASGKELPLALPLVAAEEGAEEILPRRWQVPAMERSRGNLAAATTQHSPAALAEMSEQLASEDDFLQGLRAAMGQRAGATEAQMGDGMAKGQSAEALFKLAGMTLVKETPLAPAAASSIASSAPLPSLPTAGAAPLPQLPLDAPLRQPGWDQAFAERVVWMARQGLQQAEIQLNPRNLGPIEVHVSVDKDQASVAFTAQHAVTREALEAALPRLREMLQGNGLNLAQSEVSQHSLGQQQREAAGSSGEQGHDARGDANSADEDEMLLGETALDAGRGLSAVDYYA